MQIYEHDTGHMTNMAKTLIYIVNPSIILLGNRGELISMKLSM